MSLSVEKMQMRDIESLCALEKLCFSQPWSRSSFESELENPYAMFLVAKEDGSLVGYVGCHTVCGEGNITNIAVLPQKRRHGIAGLLIKELISAMPSREADRLFLEVRKSNAAAQALYEKNGFEFIGWRRNFYTKPTEDALIMQLRIKKVKK